MTGMSDLQLFQFYSKYSRWSYKHGRRETWEESINRSVNFLRELSQNKLDEQDYEDIRNAMLDMRAFPSMRLFAMAGPAARRNNISIYNCAYLPIDSLDAFVEVLLISMAGCGVGFSVEQKYIDMLPPVAHERLDKMVVYYTVEDSTEGWADALRFCLESYWLRGINVAFDYSRVRPAGSILRIKGGRASGPEPLRRLIQFIKKKMKVAEGRRLTSTEVYDITTMIGDCVVSGGMRRSAQIALFDLSDEEMLASKTGQFWLENPQRFNANNSAIMPEGKMRLGDITKLIEMMRDSGSGEPGIVHRTSMRETMPARRSGHYDFGMNPCGEIILRPRQFCNLSQAIARPTDTLESLKDKVRIAAIIGTIQSMATNFSGLSNQTWFKNAVEERLLGVDITGQMDSPLVQDGMIMSVLKGVAVSTNVEYAEKLGIERSAAVTCVKPSGNSSVLFDCSPGLHTRYAPFYLRRVRVNAHSPVRKAMERSGINLVPEVGQSYGTATTLVAEFPVKSPDGAITNGRPAIEQLRYWLAVKQNWTEHNPSCTIYYQSEEIPEIIDWLYQHQGFIGGLSFLPYSDHVYQLAPLEEITEEEYYYRKSIQPSIDWSILEQVEEEDHTEASQELACFAGVCEI